VKEVKLLDVDGNVNIMAFKLRNKNIPENFKAHRSSRSPLRVTNNDPEPNYTYVGGDENTANERFYYKEVEEKMSDEDWNALSKEEQDRLNNAYKVIEKRDDWENTEHWSKQRDDIYKDHGGDMITFLQRKVRKKFGDSFRAKTWKEDFDGMNNPQLVDWFTNAFNKSKSEQEFIDWAQVNAPYVLERGARGENVYSRSSRGKNAWKKQ